MNSPSTAPDYNTPPPPGSSWRTVMWGAALTGLLILAFLLGGKLTGNPLPPTPDTSFVTPPQSVEAPIMVDIRGRVKHPGVYELPFNSRVYQAINKAGGALPDADLSAINQAAWADDGSQINVPPKTTIEAPAEKPDTSKSTFDANVDIPLGLTPEKPAPAKPSTSPTPKSTFKPKSKPTKELPREPIDLNRATADQLQQLPSVGPATAERILQYRKEIHGFTTVDDLIEVRGIGNKTLEKIRPFATVKPLPFQKKNAENKPS